MNIFLIPPCIQSDPFVQLINKYCVEGIGNITIAVICNFAPVDAMGKCVYCSHCDKSFTFNVCQSERMKEIAVYFRRLQNDMVR